MSTCTWEKSYWPENPHSTYLNSDAIQDFRETPYVPRKGRTICGYGGALPTVYMIKVANRWYRIRVAQWANAGTAYITVKGKDLILEDTALFRFYKHR